MIRPWTGSILAILVIGCGARDRSAPPADAGTILTARTLGLAYVEENRLEEAEEQFVKLIRLAPEEPSGHANLGLVYLRLGRYEDAERAIGRAVALASDDPDIRLLQATALRLTGRPADARRTLEAILKTTPTHLKSLYALAEIDSSARRREYLARLVETAPANVPARLAYAAALLDAGATALARDQLELLRQRLPELPPQAQRFYAAAVSDLQANRVALARAALARATAFLETTAVYQAGMAELRAPAGAPPGYPLLTLSMRLALEQQDPQAVVNALRFTEAPVSTLADSQLVIRRFAALGDYDNDGHVDAYAAGGLFHNDGTGAFTRATVIGDSAGVTAAFFADLDHDGDLDLFLGTSTGDRMYRNNGDGTFREQGLQPGPTTGAVFGDFDADARIDVIAAHQDGLVFYRGLEEGRFEAHPIPARAQAIAAGDYDNDGFLDLFAGAFYRNDGSAGFQRDTRAGGTGGGVTSATFFDFDNDGWLDLAAVGSRGLTLLHNNEKGRFTDRSALLPAAVAHTAARQVHTLDFDGDGDLDLLVVGLDQSLHLLRNDGGNANQFVNVALVGLRDGSGKNNHFGIGSRVELRAKDLYQMRVVDQPVVHFGLGNRLKADVLRVVWTNGVPQSYYYPGGASAGTDRNVLEQQVLKGSCTFLYTWDGEAYRFLTDVTWASALGMPLGIMAGEKTVYGPPQAAREYFRIPGERLKPVNGRYRMQLTEELWEVAYVDHLELLAVDHPASVDVFVDERFVPPGTPATGGGHLDIHQVREKRLPLSATDERGRDLLPLLRAKDDAYVGGFTPGPYQGITAPHDLILDVGPLGGARDIRLFLQGWLFPTDASINAAIAQGKSIAVRWPSLEVRDAAGRWRTVIENLSFPAGKDKTMIIDLTGRFLSRDQHVRIRTNMEIYWDHAFVSAGREDLAVRVTRLAPVAADLHARGWSRVFRKGGRYGPQWFDYAQVSRESPWLQVGGRFTRFGDVLPLLRDSDDQTVIMASGDEMTLEFPETGAPPLPAGWKRDFLLYNVAWMKDADLHTAAGQTVEPLPFHAATRYPYGAEQRYPDDATHRRYVQAYNTRTIRP
jgi:Flp pilus assembly protein TadD